MRDYLNDLKDIIKPLIQLNLNYKKIKYKKEIKYKNILINN